MGLYINKNEGTQVSPSKLSESSLDLIIPPEIKDDNFYYLLNYFSKLPEIRNVFEIGS